MTPNFSLNPNLAACRHLIERRFVLHELPSLVEAVLSSEDEGEIICNFNMVDAQTLADVIDEASHPLLVVVSLLIGFYIDPSCSPDTARAKSSILDPKAIS